MVIPGETRLFRPQGPHRTAIVTVEPSHARPEESLIRVAVGQGHKAQSSIYGLFAKPELETQFAQLIGDLKAEGYGPPGRDALLSDLRSVDPGVRGRAALRIGWRRDAECVDELLSILPQAVDDVCSILDALGMIGDPRAIPAIRPYVERKLLSRRRSAVEALRRLGDAEGLARAAELAKERLPASVVEALPGDSAQIVEVVQTLPVNERGPALDALYELAMPQALTAVREVLSKTAFGQPHIWRNVKSILKRAMLRHDDAMLGWIFYEAERQGRLTHGVMAQVKSGYDGQQRMTPIFNRNTQNYLRRQAWRYLRTLARWRPQYYAHAAAEMMIPYVPEDARKPSGLRGAFSHCYVLSRILFGGSSLWRFKSRSATCRFVSNKAAHTFYKGQVSPRSEAYPFLWDREPRAYLRLLARARLREVHEFAYQAVSGPSRPVLKVASFEELADMLNGPYAASMVLAISELRERYEPTLPAFWSAFQRLALLQSPAASDLLAEWMRRSADLWRADAVLAFGLLTSVNPEVRSLAADLLIESPPDASVRQSLAQWLLDLIRDGGEAAGIEANALDSVCRAGREAFAAELEANLTLDDLMNWIAHPAAPVQALGGGLLSRRPGAHQELGIERISALAEHEVAGVREAARRLVVGDLDRLRQDPSLLFALIESDWEDNRQFAFDLLRQEIGYETLGFDGLFGLLDSTRSDVRALGRDFARQGFARWPVRGFLDRLIEHPSRDMRQFALELAEHHLPEGAHALEQASGLFRASVLDLWPSRSVKNRILAMLQNRGLRDRDQALVAIRLLSDFARLRSRRDREPALEALTRIQLAFPDLTGGIVLRPSAIVDAVKRPLSSKKKQPGAGVEEWPDLA